MSEKEINNTYDEFIYQLSNSMALDQWQRCYYASDFSNSVWRDIAYNL